MTSELSGHPFFWVAAWFLALSVLSYLQFYWDKRQAVRGGWRIPESTLLWTALLGGAIGAKFGQLRFRHKTRKQPFRTALNLAVGINFLSLLLLGSPGVRDRVFGLFAEILSLHAA